MAYQSILNPHPVKLPESDAHALSVNEQIDQIFAAQCATVHLLGQILATLQGRTCVLPGEEVDQLVFEFTRQRNAWNNINN